MTEDFEPAAFRDFQAGDTIQFWTNDNGYGGVGEIWRTGTVTKVTAKTLVIDCESNRLGKRAVIRLADWSRRCPMKRVPYRVEIDRFVRTPRGGTERCDVITVVSESDGTKVFDKWLPFDSHRDLIAEIRCHGWEVQGELSEAAGPRFLIGRANRMTNST
ncbi:hypothetical protein [Kitasatospora sp. NPDC056731]|uniref:hypothetical protein n=1 Tax=Kitasatospora sp. NPDC056731 TaxID=3155422 RepID=UPI0034320E19